MAQLKPERYPYLSEVAEMLNMPEDEFISKLTADGYLTGNTQSRRARELRLFYVEAVTPRWKGGLYHNTKFGIRATTKGVKHFLYKYGKHEEIKEG